MTAKNHLILYVDDERGNRVVFEQALTRRFQIKTASDATEALQVLRNQPVAVLVTDQRMPGMSGLDLLAEVKATYPETIRIIITAYSDLDPILRAVNDGLVARYLLKPWDRAELEQVLSWAVEAYVLGRENSALQLRLLQTERLVTLGSIGAAIVHDLNQPLSHFTLNTERLAALSRITPRLAHLIDAHKGELSEEEQSKMRDLVSELPEIVKELALSAKLMGGLTRNMRQFLRPERSTDGPMVDPIPVIRFALSVCRETALLAEARLLYDGPSVLPKVKIGSTELTQVFINLVSNSTQALLQGGVPGGTVSISAREAVGQITFVVADSGPGMSAEMLRKVGTPFFSTRAEGTGLGVAQCRRLIEQSGGSLDISSIESRGTTVTIRLSTEVP